MLTLMKQEPNVPENRENHRDKTFHVAHSWDTVCVFSQSRGEDMKNDWMAVQQCEVGTYEDYVDYGPESAFSWS